MVQELSGKVSKVPSCATLLLNTTLPVGLIAVVVGHEITPVRVVDAPKAIVLGLADKVLVVELAVTLYVPVPLAVGYCSFTAEYAAVTV